MLQPTYGFHSAAAVKKQVIWPGQVKTGMLLNLEALAKHWERPVLVASWSNMPVASDGSGRLVELKISSEEDREDLLAAWHHQSASPTLCKGKAGHPR